jgi:hypothetical protein
VGAARSSPSTSSDIKALDTLETGTPGRGHKALSRRRFRADAADYAPNPHGINNFMAPPFWRFATMCDARTDLPPGVNRRHELTPAQSIISMFYRADRRWDPTPNDRRLRPSRGRPVRLFLRPVFFKLRLRRSASID